VRHSRKKQPHEGKQEIPASAKNKPAYNPEQTIIMNDVTNNDVKSRFSELYDELFRHDGYGRIELEMKILRRGQKEIILRCGKEYRYVIDFPEGKKMRPTMESSPLP